MSKHTTVYVDTSCPDDGSDNYDRDIRIEVRCSPGRPMHWPSPRCETGCPAEDAEFEIIGAMFTDGAKEKVPDATMEKLDLQRIEEQAAELAADQADAAREDRDDFRRDRDLDR